VCAVVVGGHLAFLLWIGHHRDYRQQTLSEWPIEIISIRGPERAASSATQPGHKTTPGVGQRHPHAAAVPPNAQESAPPSTDDRPANASTDWDTDPHRVADEILRREQEKAGRRSFAHAFAEPTAPDRPGIFGSQKENHRAGLVEGGTRFWVTDNCYFDFPRGTPPPRLAGEFHLLTRQCKPAPTGGGDRMFEDMTPDSLRKLPAVGASQ
jgi:hypothetical protein